MKIIDNFIPEKDYKTISSVIMSNDFPFYFQDKVAFERDKNFYFTHEFFNERKVKSDFFNLLDPILDKISISNLLRIKANCFPSTEKMIKYEPHIDFSFKHNGAIYYINTCNGGTYIGDKFIKSIANRLLLFDSSKLHQSTNCTDKKCRFNININYF
jgi:hypothetical protein